MINSSNADLDALSGALRKASDALREAANAVGKARSEPGENGGPRADLLTGRQLGAIHGMARRAGLSRDKLVELVAELTGKRDITRLSRTEASDILDRLNGGLH
jgi:hypothetical protein